MDWNNPQWFGLIDSIIFLWVMDLSGKSMITQYHYWFQNAAASILCWWYHSGCSDTLLNKLIKGLSIEFAIKNLKIGVNFCPFNVMICPSTDTNPT